MFYHVSVCRAIYAHCIITLPVVMVTIFLELNICFFSYTDENSRVVLDKLIGEECSDYINASYINVSVTDWSKSVDRMFLALTILLYF